MSSKKYTFIFSWLGENVLEVDENTIHHYAIYNNIDVGRMAFQYAIFQDYGLGNLVVQVETPDGDWEPIRYDSWDLIPSAFKLTKLCATCSLILDWYYQNAVLSLATTGNYSPMSLEGIAELILTRKIEGLRYE